MLEFLLEMLFGNFKPKQGSGTESVKYKIFKDSWTPVFQKQNKQLKVYWKSGFFGFDSVDLFIRMADGMALHISFVLNSAK